MWPTYMLDTSVIITLSTKGGFESMPKRVQRILTEPGNELVISTISEFEIAQKVRKGKLFMTQQDLARVCIDASIHSQPFRQRHSLHMFDLPMHHEDPFDRMIISHAIVDDLPIIAKDAQFPKYEGLNVIWR